METLIPYTEIKSQIFWIRGRKVMLDFHLAALYEVETRVLKQQVKRNLNRFPDDFMFQLTDKEVDGLVSQFVIPSKSKLGGALPLAFTEQGVAMLSGVLRSDRAIEVNIAIMRAFVQMRELINENNELRLRLHELEKKYDQKFQFIFDALRNIIVKEEKPRNVVGFHRETEG